MPSAACSTRHAERPAIRSATARSANAGVELQPPAGEVVGIEVAEHDGGVGHRRFGAAAAVAGGPRAPSQPTAGPTRSAAARVEPGDAAAAGADRVHVDHGTRIG